MSLASIDELTAHMLLAYQVSHFHYILGKREPLKGTFPYQCCGPSARSVMMSLIHFGFPNAAYGYSDNNDHGYTILPFVMESRKIQGVVVVDPTSDQLWKTEHPRNAVFIKLGVRWEYITNWEEGADLYPDLVCSFDLLKSKPNMDISDSFEYHPDAEQYFLEAFSNPVTVKPDCLRPTPRELRFPTPRAVEREIECG